MYAINKEDPTTDAFESWKQQKSSAAEIAKGEELSSHSIDSDAIGGSFQIDDSGPSNGFFGLAGLTIWRMLGAIILIVSIVYFYRQLSKDKRK